MNTVKVQIRGRLTEQLRVAQELQRRFRPSRSVGILTRNTTAGTIRSAYVQTDLLAGYRNTARWA